ncbi:MAG TPA: tetratricopeptide repeat protein [Candidatus Acidoferrales bacterium]|nr:tetratricopeptide repeat protein [Candidatus Acidoferrales bacterium]
MNETTFAQAMQLRDRGQESAAVELLRNMLAEASSAEDRISILLNLVTCYARLGDIEQSRMLADQACTIAREHGNRQLSLCAEYLRAIDEFDDAKQLAMLEQLQREYSDLLASPEHTAVAIELEQRVAVALTNLKRVNEAIPTLERALARPESDHQRMHLFLALCRIQTGAVEQGISEYEQAAAGEDDAIAAEANYALGVLAWNRRDYNSARTHFAEVVRKPGSNPNAAELAANANQLILRIDQYISQH